VKTYEIEFVALYPTLFSPAGSKLTVQVWGETFVDAVTAARKRFDLPYEIWQVAGQRELPQEVPVEKRGTCGDRAYEVTFVAPKHIAFGPEGSRVTVQVLADSPRDAIDSARFRFDLPEGIWNHWSWRELPRPHGLPGAGPVPCSWCRGSHPAIRKEGDPADCIHEEEVAANHPNLSSLLYLVRVLRERINGLEDIVKEKK
jgi:hypothetical protein